MPRRFTLGSVVTMCRQCVDLENDASIADGEWKRMIGTAYAELFAEVAAQGLRYFETSQTITTTGATYYDEPADHMSTVGVDRILDTSGRRWPLRELMTQERGLAGMTGDAQGWSLVDDRLYLYPVPPSGQTYEWLYIPQPPLIASEDDDYVLDVVTPDGESFVIWAVAAMALHKHDSETRPAREERDAARERVRTWALTRSISSNRRPAHEDSEFSWDGDFSQGNGGWY